MKNKKDRTIYQLLNSRANRNPDAVAIVSPRGRSLTYRQLFTEVNQVIEDLRTIGIGRNDRIAIVVPNGPDMVVAFLAAAGCAISAPLNPAYPEQEYENYLSDLHAKALIVQAGFDSPARTVARKHGIPIVTLSSEPRAGSGFDKLAGAPRSASRNDAVPGADDIALVLYTSGTTAKPKRVPLTHKNLLASAGSIKAGLELKAADRCLTVMPLHHIHGLVGALLSSLAAGASIAVPAKFDPDTFVDCIEELRPTWYTAVPAIHQAVLSAGKTRVETIRRAPLRFIRSSSAPLPAKLAAELEELFKAPVIEAYGMTEASHQIAANPLPPGNRKVGSVGIAAGPQVRIIDATGQPVPVGQRGEVVVHGANVTQGYEGDNRVNDDTFIDRWLRTGDEGYLDAEGYLFLTGRLKEIINRGGEKVSPREVDETLLEHPDISQAAAFPVPHPTLGEDVAAVVVLRHGSTLTESSIREHLAARVAEFKIPHQLLILDAIPTSATGKVNRGELAKIFSERLTSDFVATMNEVETEVAEIYREVLGIYTLSATDNFFALGGDSLRATQIINRIRAKFGLNLPIVTIFRKPTVAELAEEMLRSADQGSTESADVA